VRQQFLTAHLEVRQQFEGGSNSSAAANRGNTVFYSVFDNFSTTGGYWLGRVVTGRFTVEQLR